MQNKNSKYKNSKYNHSKWLCIRVWRRFSTNGHETAINLQINTLSSSSWILRQDLHFVNRSNSKRMAITRLQLRLGVRHNDHVTYAVSIRKVSFFLRQSKYITVYTSSNIGSSSKYRKQRRLCTIPSRRINLGRIWMMTSFTGEILLLGNEPT